MPLAGCCPSCGFAGDVEAFLIEPDAKRVIARVAALDPVLGRAVAPYLRLFAAGTRGVQLRRAVRLIDELVALVDAGTVCRDERGGVRRPASPALWAAGIEQMLANPPSGPLQNHHYLRAVVFGLADSADATAERQREETARRGRHRVGESPAAKADPLADAMAYVRQMVEYGRMTTAEGDDYLAKARARVAAE